MASQSAASIETVAAAIDEGTIVHAPEVAVRLVVVKTMLKPMSVSL